MRRGNKHFLHIVLVLGLMRRNTHAAAVLRLILRHRQALDISRMRQGDDDVLFVDEIRVLDGAVIHGNFRAAGRRIAVFDVDEVGADNRHHPFLVRENIFEVGDRRFESCQFVFEFIHFERGEPLQTHFQNCVRLLFVQLESFRQFGDRRELIRRFLDDLNHLVDIRKRQNESRNDMRALLRLVQLIPGTPRNDFLLMREVVSENFPEIQSPRLRAVFHERQHDDAVGNL